MEAVKNELLKRSVDRFSYFKRILSAYVFCKNSQLTFWYEEPVVNPEAFTDRLGQYYMTFRQKALYSGPFDGKGIPLLNYHGKVGLQYNPIVVAQYALGNFNLAKQTSDENYYSKFLLGADWLLNNLFVTDFGTYLWPHNFDFEYFRPLVAPWFSGLAQGQGLSVLIRAHVETGDPKYLQAAQKVLWSLLVPVSDGGVQYKDSSNYIWIEEYLIEPPTHILNGFIWALWGIYDYYLFNKKREVKELFDAYTATILHYLEQYDLGFWSLYELTPQRIRSIASSYYHRLHIVQLDIMYRLTGHKEFAEYARRWGKYTDNVLYCFLAKSYKAVFKILYY
jgi:heparosan-N-sulfate-glucuronate 5-epimerase